MELFKASNQWATRPADERFWDLPEMIRSCETYRTEARESKVNFNRLKVFDADGEIYLKGQAGAQARLTNWAFGQLCQDTGCPASYMRSLPAPLAAQNLNNGFSNLANDQDRTCRLFFHKNGDYLLRAVTGPNYTRIWNADIARRLLDIVPQGWKVPPARPANVPGERTRLATAEDCLRLQKSGLSIQPGDAIAPAGLYASDHDCFIFMVNEDRTIDDGTGHGLGRGFFIWNSEVGAASFGIMTFLYDAVCGNHIVWGARGVHEIRIRHIGNADREAFSSIRGEIIKYSDESASDTQAVIARARKFEFGTDRETALDGVMKLIQRTPAAMGRKTLEAAYDAVEKSPHYGSPRSAWGIVNGLTELSQKTGYADERMKMDRAAGKILEVAF